MRVINDTEGVRSLMLIGHNPMCGMLAHSLSGSGDPALIEKISYKYPTSTISVLEFDCDTWEDIAFGGGKLVDCIIPSEH